MAELKYDKKTGRLLFTKQMKKEYTILMPNMSPIHFRILQNVFRHYFRLHFQTSLLLFIVSIDDTLCHFTHPLLVGKISTSFGAVLCVALLRSECGSTPLANHSFVNHLFPFYFAMDVQLRPMESNCVQ